MKKVLLTIALMLLPMLASAQNKVEINGIWYNLNNGTKTVEGVVNAADVVVLINFIAGKKKE